MDKPRTHALTAADGVDLFVTDAGPLDGEVVMLVHGWPDTHAVWRTQIGPLTDAGYRVIAHDQRGFGRSGRPPEVSDYHVFNAMADLGSIMDALDIADAHLVGHDWGAPPCWLAGMFSPERVRSLTAVSVGHPLAFRDMSIEQRQRSFYMLLFQFVDVAETWLSADDWANMRMLIGETGDWPERREALSKPGALTSSLNWYRANMSPESYITEPPELPPVTVPTLGVIGEKDWALLPRQMIDSEKYMEATWRYEVIADAHHWLQTEASDAFNLLLIEWLGSQRSV